MRNMVVDKNTLPVGYVLKSQDNTYRIDAVLGRGGFGITYLASAKISIGNIPLNAQFAIKEHFPSDFCIRQNNSVIAENGKEADYNRSKLDFISEAKKLHALGSENENIVKVNEVFEENQTAYYVMQYIDGISLTEYVKTKKRLSYTEALSLLLPIINAVGFLHKSRINHLDIKPDNIMLYDGIDEKVPVLIDFGLSVHFKKNGDKTSPKEVMGVSEGYSPLEQYAGIKKFNPATDIYSLAATMLYALTGVTPKRASDLKLSEVRTTLAKAVPQQAIDALCCALKKSYDDRTSSVSAFKSDLGVEGTGGKDTELIVVDDEKWKRYMLIVVSVIAIIAIIAGCVYLMRPKQQPPIPPIPIETKDTIATEGATVVASPSNDSIQKNAKEEGLVQNNQNKQSENNNTTQRQPEPQTQHQTNTTEHIEKPVVTTGTLSFGYAIWRGGIKNGQPDGKGRMTFTSTHKVDSHSSVEANSGDYFDATYDNGGLISGKLYDSNGTLLKTIIP
jgi:serine/threonine protein kinase